MQFQRLRAISLDTFVDFGIRRLLAGPSGVIHHAIPASMGFRSNYVLFIYLFDANLLHS